MREQFFSLDKSSLLEDLFVLLRKSSSVVWRWIAPEALLILRKIVLQCTSSEKKKLAYIQFVKINKLSRYGSC